MENELKFTEDWSYRGLRTIIMENSLVRLSILLDLGAKMHEFIYKPLDTDFLWHNPRVKAQKAPLGGKFDDFWSGGWDEIFPCDTQCQYKGDFYPDHGELWSLGWDYELEEHSAERLAVRLRTRGFATPSIVEKQIVLKPGETKVTITYTVKNEGFTDMDFVWKIHPAFAVTPQHRIDIPAEMVIVDPSFRDELPQGVDSFKWPLMQLAGGETRDMRKIPPAEAGITHFQYAAELRAGWCAVTDTERRVGLGLVFPKDLFPFIWLFLPYGGWRGHYTALLEPSVGCPYDFNETVARGNFLSLQPGR
ncbi:MAG: aldose epimerase family protein, partial [Eubacteriales bacterium]